MQSTIKIIDFCKNSQGRILKEMSSHPLRLCSANPNPALSHISQQLPQVAIELSYRCNMQQSHPQVPRVVLALGALLSIRFTSVGELQTHFEMYQVQSQGEVGNCSKEVQNASRRDRRIWIGKQMHRLNSASCLKCLLKAMDRFIFPPLKRRLFGVNQLGMFAGLHSKLISQKCL